MKPVATLCCAILCSCCATRAEDPNAWQTVKSEHFLVLHTGDRPLAEKIAHKAEHYYATIAADLGYTRYHNFWRWDRRVRILIYDTQAAFAQACQAPAWAAGSASHERHQIASYRQAGDEFLAGVLPHELAHLIMADFIGADRLPLWLTEGFAQWEQENRPARFDGEPGLPQLPLPVLMAADIRREANPQVVRLFYRQSASVVGYMIMTYGGDRFGRFCRALRDGKTCDEALAKAYPDTISSAQRLEQEWRRPRHR